jgi:hypothetical protein
MGLKNVMGRHGLGTRNKNGDMFIDLCVNYNLVIGGSLFPHKDIHKAIWVAPNQRTLTKLIMSPSARNEGGHFLMSVATWELM